jgi:hypothetical protein
MEGYKHQHNLHVCYFRHDKGSQVCVLNIGRFLLEFFNLLYGICQAAVVVLQNIVNVNILAGFFKQYL